ncbi:Sirohydrochlorin cobaltochelatase [Candidatus Hodgkinia cicadicola]|uniref:Sirohydrochlorin cobaltochelatase n=1 Tax=Candidatus Hodgkinia cicadicola TaxID=573658 RepID=A0ABX4MGB7_9HYPH|nr:Sirohydrochlorin cobaltochelatase [Candidatus Hodgkinia cicadicola]
MKDFNRFKNKIQSFNISKIEPSIKKSNIYIFFLGHGSNEIGTTAEFIYIVDLFKILHPCTETGFWLLEFGKIPLKTSFNFRFDINIIVPMMIFSSKHIKNDVCILCNYLQSLLKKKIIIMIKNPCSNLLNIKLICKFLDRCKANKNFKTSTSTLVLAFRGGSDIQSNSQAYLLSRLLWEGIGFGYCEILFIGVTFPLLNSIQTLKFSSNIIIIPLLLFYGNLYKQININFKHHIITCYIFNHIHSVLTLFRIIKNLFNEYNYNNCILCKHRFLSMI